MEAESSAQRQASIDFLAENALRSEVTVTDSGLQYEVLERSGSSVSPTAADTIRVHYHGTLIDGTVFDSSIDRGEPIEFPLDSVITGWIEGVQLMSEGDRFMLYLPPELGYGDSATGMIPPSSVLIFEVELLAVL
jgi:FKBP-type peptidyl-prolyl cis-trans isomerase FklB